MFAFGFAKSDQANIDTADERDLKAAAKLALSFSDAQLDQLVQINELEELTCDAEG